MLSTFVSLLNRTVHMNHGAEEHQAHFRSGSPSQFRSGSPSHLRSVAIGPQTGLSVLMSGRNLHPPQQVQSTTALTAFGTMTGSAKDETRSQDDMFDRDRQASALAAAGMVADSISLSRTTSGPDRVHSSTSLASHGLEAPPQLAGHVPPPVPSSSSELDNVNWNLMDLGQMHLDDMDMDFARLFDPAQEAENMQTEGSGWPSAATSTDTSTLSFSEGKPS
jgi:hypothetical protein